MGKYGPEEASCLDTFHALNNCRTVIIGARKTDMKKKHSRGYFITTTPALDSKYLIGENKKFEIHML